MKKGIINAILVLFILVFVGSGLYLLRYYMQANETKKQLQELTEMTDTATVTVAEIQEAKEMGVLEKYIRLYKKNPDLAAWIRVKGTRIDYPVMQNKNDSEYYLHRNFQKKTDKNGLPFLAGECNIKDINSNFLVYGHHMKSGMMFTDLLKYAEKDFYETHSSIQFDTVSETGTYQVFAAFYTDVTEGSKHVKFYDYAGTLDEESFEKYVKEVAEKSLYKGRALPQYGQSLLTLVTCSYHKKNGRFVVVAAK